MDRQKRTTYRYFKNFRKDNYFHDPEPLVPLVNNPTYIAQPDALRVARAVIPPAMPSRATMPIIPNVHADGGMLYGNQEAMPSAPQEFYQQGEMDDTQEPPKQWDDLSLAEKNAFIATAVKHGITNMEDIRKAYDELAQGNMNDYALQDNMNEETSPYNDDGSSIDQDSANVSS